MADESKKTLLIEAVFDGSKAEKGLKRFESVMKKAESIQPSFKNPAINNVRNKYNSMLQNAVIPTQSQLKHYQNYGANGKGAKTRSSNNAKLINSQLSMLSQSGKNAVKPVLPTGATYSSAANGPMQNLKAGSIKNSWMPFTTKISPALTNGINAAKKAIEAFKAKLAPYIKVAEKAWDITKKLGSSFLKVSKNVIKSTAGFIKSKIHIGDLSKKLKNLEKAFKRVLLYKVIRSILSVVNNGLKTGISNLYKFSSVVNGKFKSTMDSFATSWVYAQNAVGALAGTIMNAFMPVINALLDKFAQLANAAAKFFGLVSGKGYAQATKAATSYAEALGEAAANQRQLMGFDELNVLSSGSGSGEGAMSEFDNFTEGIGSVEEAIDRVTSKINEFFAGEYIVDAAGAIGEKINNVATLFNSFMDKINFEQMGTSIANGIDALINAINPETLATALTQKINAAIDFLKGFVENFEWNAAGQWLSALVTGWFDSIEWENLRAAISGFINGLFDSAKSFIEATDWSEKAQAVGKYIQDLVNDIEWENIGSTINSWVKSLLDSAISFFQSINWKDVGAKIYSALASIDWGEIFSKLGQLIWNAAKSMVSTVAGFFSERATTKRNDFASSGSSWDIQPRANGGSVSSGSLFLAGEAGPELVTQIGGKSTVYNEQQLGSSLAYANESVVSAIMAATSSILSGMAENKTVVSIGDREIARAATRGSKLTGNSLIQGA